MLLVKFKQMPNFKVKAKLVEVVQKPYKMEGNEGISYKLRFLVGDELWEIKSSLEQTESLKSAVKQTGDAEFVIKSRKETVTLALAIFITK